MPPFTRSRYIVVNRILASNYVTPHVGETELLSFNGVQIYWYRVCHGTRQHRSIQESEPNNPNSHSSTFTHGSVKCFFVAMLAIVGLLGEPVDTRNAYVGIIGWGCPCSNTCPMTIKSLWLWGAPIIVALGSSVKGGEEILLMTTLGWMKTLFKYFAFECFVWWLQLAGPRDDWRYYHIFHAAIVHKWDSASVQFLSFALG